MLHCINSVVLYLVHKLGRQISLFITGHADTNGLDIKSVPWSRPNNRAGKIAPFKLPLKFVDGRFWASTRKTIEPSRR